MSRTWNVNMQSTRRGFHTSFVFLVGLRACLLSSLRSTILVQGLLLVVPDAMHRRKSWSHSHRAVVIRSILQLERLSFRFPKISNTVIKLSADSGDSYASTVTASSNDETKASVPSLLPSLTESVSSPMNISSSEQAANDMSFNPTIVGPSSTSVQTMLTAETKRVLIEELGYRRRDVERMRVELAGPIIEQRIRSPPGNKEMPEAWLDPDLPIASTPSNDRMLQQLQSESRFPLKFPLLGISAILFGKGLSDALITLIKVNQGFPGATLTKVFVGGIPVLAIDALCVLAGASLGAWAWTAMRDAPPK